MAVKPADPTLDGYTFGGWYLDWNYNEAYDFNAEVTEDLWLYAKWTKNAPVVDDDPVYTPNIDTSEGGNTTVSDKNPAKGDKVTITVTYVPQEADFTDVHKGDYYYNAVNRAVAEGITNGITPLPLLPT